VNKHEFAVNLAERCDFSKAEASRALDGILESLTDVLTDRDEVSFPGWGKFSVQYRRGREASDPRRPNRRIHVPPGYVPKFKPGSNLRRDVQDAFVGANGDQAPDDQGAGTATTTLSSAGADATRNGDARAEQHEEALTAPGVWRPLANR